MNDNYLMHYQVKGAKHGVRRYQNEDGSLTPLGRIHYGIGQARVVISKAVNKARTNIHNAAENSKNKKIAKQKAEEEAKQKAEEESKQKEAEILKAKDEAIASADPDKIIEFANKMSTQELNEALNRARTLANVRDLSDKNKEKNQDPNKPASVGETIKENIKGAVKEGSKTVGGQVKGAALAGIGTLLSKASERQEDERAKKLLSFFGKKLKDTGAKEIAKATGAKQPDDPSFESINISDALDAARKMSPEKRVEFAQYLNSLKVISDAQRSLTGGNSDTIESMFSNIYNMSPSDAVKLKDVPGNWEKFKAVERDIQDRKALRSAEADAAKMLKTAGVEDVGSAFLKKFEEDRNSYVPDSNGIMVKKGTKTWADDYILEGTSKSLNSVMNKVNSFTKNDVAKNKEIKWNTDSARYEKAEKRINNVLDKIGDFDLFAYTG